MLSPDTISIQTKLGDYCRTGLMPEIPGIHKTHIKHYRRLISNIVSNNIRQAFPIARQIIGADDFREMINEFFREYDAQTSQIWKLPGEFYSYAIAALWAKKFEMPWLDDLLLFEWTELKVHTMPDENIPNFRNEGDLLTDNLVFLPDHEIIQLSYPVHIYAANEAKEKKGNYFLLVFREKENGRVRFINLSVFFAYLLLKIHEENTKLDHVIKEAFLKFEISEGEKYLSATLSFFEDLKKQGFLLGYLDV